MLKRSVLKEHRKLTLSIVCLGLLAGAFDALGIRSTLRETLGGADPSSHLGLAGLVEALCLQALDPQVRRKMSLSSEYYSAKPLDVLAWCPGAASGELSLERMTKSLDDLQGLPLVKIFSKCAAQAALAIGVKPRAFRLAREDFDCDPDFFKRADAWMGVIVEVGSGGAHASKWSSPHGGFSSWMAYDMQSGIPLCSRCETSSDDELPLRYKLAEILLQSGKPFPISTA